VTAPAVDGDLPVRPLRLTFLVRSMERGGAERQLMVLARGLRRRGHEVSVVVFYAGGPLEEELRAGGVRVRAVGKRGRWDVLSFFTRLHRLLREERPHVLHAYLPTPNVIAAALRPTMPGVRVVWGQRASNLDLNHDDWLARAVDRLTIALSRFPDLVIVNSRAGFAHAASIGYPVKKMVVIPNGIDTDHFTVDRAAGRALRDAWGLRDDERVVGLVARVDPIKAHDVFLKAAAALASERADVRFVCIGDIGDATYAEAMRTLAGQLGLAERLVWAGGQSDMRAVYNALDIACLSSTAEGFPNVIGEAMACGLPCVSTDVGDAAWLLDDQTLLAPAGDWTAFADRIRQLLLRAPDDLARLGAAARERVASCFSVASLIRTTERTLLDLVRRDSLQGEAV
jgi:glycosyltransferase involved in cell wall biosynthesis